MTEIRTASTQDAARLLEIYAPYVQNTAVSFEYDVPSEAEFAGRIAKTLEKYPYITIRVDGVLAGYAYAGVFHARRAYDRSAELSIYLDEAYRGQGLGQLLYAELENRLRAIGVTNLYACIACPNTEDDPYLTLASPRFHEKHGYHRVGFFQNCAEKFGRLYSMVYMEKLL